MSSQLYAYLTRQQRQRKAAKATPAPPRVNAETWRKISRHYPTEDEQR